MPFDPGACKCFTVCASTWSDGTAGPVAVSVCNAYGVLYKGMPAPQCTAEPILPMVYMRLPEPQPGGWSASPEDCSACTCHGCAQQQMSYWGMGTICSKGKGIYSRTDRGTKARHQHRESSPDHCQSLAQNASSFQSAWLATGYVTEELCDTLDVERGSLKTALRVRPIILNPAPPA